jgi:hypothetical protein
MATLVERVTALEVNAIALEASTMHNTMSVEACTIIVRKLVDEILPGIERNKERLLYLHKPYCT